jgi:hypothetical protein
VLDEPLAGKFRASLLTDGVYAIGSNGFDSIELIAVEARVDGFNDRPGRPVPVLGEESEMAATPKRMFWSAPGLGLGTTDQTLPSKCSMSVCCWNLPFK